MDNVLTALVTGKPQFYQPHNRQVEFFVGYSISFRLSRRLLAAYYCSLLNIS